MGIGFRMVRPERFELPAFWFVARRSIQLSYGRIPLLTASQQLTADSAFSSTATFSVTLKTIRARATEVQGCPHGIRFRISGSHCPILRT